MIEVHLKWDELYHAAGIGVQRRMFAMRSNLNRQQGGKIGLWDCGDDVSGAIAEKAFSKWSGLPWTGTVGQTDKPDFPGVELKSSKWGNRAGLYVQQWNSADAVYVLATPPDGRAYDMSGMIVCLRGWMRGSEAKTYPADSRGASFRYPAHYVPQDKLHLMELMPMPAGSSVL